jgi:hypothetical protein
VCATHCHNCCDRDRDRAATAAMLSLSPEYVKLLGLGGHPLHELHPLHLPPLPLSPYAYCVVGRLSLLQCINNTSRLITGIKAFSVETAIKKCQNAPLPSAHPSGRIVPYQQPAEPVDIDAAATAAENPEWLREIESSMRGSDLKVRYLNIEDLLHTNSYAQRACARLAAHGAPMHARDHVGSVRCAALRSSCMCARALVVLSASPSFLARRVSRFHFVIKKEVMKEPPAVDQSVSQCAAHESTSASARGLALRPTASPAAPVCYKCKQPYLLSAALPIDRADPDPDRRPYAQPCTHSVCGACVAGPPRMTACHQCGTAYGAAPIPVNLGFIEMCASIAAPAAPAPAAAAASPLAAPAAAAGAPRYRYFVKDTGSLNGLYVNGFKVKHKNWTLLAEGATIRFAPQTKNAKVRASAAGASAGGRGDSQSRASERSSEV